MNCAMDGCAKEVLRSNRQGWCRMHLTRWERHGDPNIVLPTSRPQGDAPSYRAAHARVVKRKGPARDLSCIGCGGPAHHWAYDHADVDEATGVAADGVTVCTYSVNPDHYQPMCRSCHATLDARPRVAARTHCAHGHELTPENTFVNLRGGRLCRTCKRSRSAASNARRRAAK